MTANYDRLGLHSHHSLWKISGGTRLAPILDQVGLISEKLMASRKIKKKTRYWVAVGTLAAYSAAGTGKVALAQEKSAPHLKSSDHIQTVPKRRYDIPAGPLDAVITAFKIASGLE